MSAIEERFGSMELPLRRSLVLVGVYLIVHRDGVYVGATENHYKRRAQNRSALKRGTHHCSLLQDAYNRHPHVMFKTILTTVDDLYRIEIQTIGWCRKNGYCVFNQGGEDSRSPRKGVCASDNTREKLRLAATERFKTQEARNKLSAAMSAYMKSEEARKKISLAKTGVRIGPCPEES